MVDNPLWEICEPWRRCKPCCMIISLSEAELLRAMFDVGYFPPNTPPDE